MRFDGKVALISGGGSGVGRATAIAFAQRGAKVAVVDVNGESAGKTMAEIEATGGTAIAIVADLAVAGEVDAMAARTMNVFGRLDILHNNAYGSRPTAQQSGVTLLAELDQARWDHAIKIGLTAVMQAIKAVVPIMQKQGGGTIVNTSSIAGLFADAGTAAYNTVKAGVINLTRAVALEYARDGMRGELCLPGRDRHAIVAKCADRRRLRGSDQGGDSDETDWPSRRDCQRRAVSGVRPGLVRDWRDHRG